MAKCETTPIFTNELVMEILNKTLEELQSPSNTKKLEEAKDNVGNEMLKMMQFVFPIVMTVQMDILKDYGFTNARESVIRFAQTLRTLERDDVEIARLHSQIKAYYLPPVAANVTGDSPADDKTNST